jgi:MATE family multidrug resistance protein
MLLAALGYWAIGFAGGWVLAFPLGYGPVGLWWGLAIGLAAVGALLSLRLFRTAAPRARMEAPATSSPLPFPPPQPGEGQGERIGGSGG